MCHLFGRAPAVHEARGKHTENKGAKETVYGVVRCAVRHRDWDRRDKVDGQWIGSIGSSRTPSICLRSGSLCAFFVYLLRHLCSPLCAATLPARRERLHLQQHSSRQQPHHHRHRRRHRHCRHHRRHSRRCLCSHLLGTGKRGQRNGNDTKVINRSDTAAPGAARRNRRLRTPTTPGPCQ